MVLGILLVQFRVAALGFLVIIPLVVVILEITIVIPARDRRAPFADLLVNSCSRRFV